MAWLPVSLLLSVLLLAGCFTRRGNPAEGAALYAQNCAACHGPNGQGQDLTRPGGNPLPEQQGYLAPALDARGHCTQHTMEELGSIIKNGSTLPGSPMKGFAGKLSDGDIRSLLAYLRTLWVVRKP